jgi:prepilin-type N-terminal cleavage/methylation domain-containing protein
MRRTKRGFTLLEILTVIAVVAILVMILTPSLGVTREMSRDMHCLTQLHQLGRGMGLYHNDNKYQFWPYALYNMPTKGQTTYWWGTDADPVDVAASPFMSYATDSLKSLWCPNLPWGSYIPQGRYVKEHTTTYGYNAYYLSPNLGGAKTLSMSEVRWPMKVFVFNDAAMCWTIRGKRFFQNSTYLEPVTGNFIQQPTTHFRHRDLRTNALLADGHAGSFDAEGWETLDQNQLGFVGTENYPHYQPEEKSKKK